MGGRVGDSWRAQKYIEGAESREGVVPYTGWTSAFLEAKRKPGTRRGLPDIRGISAFYFCYTQSVRGSEFASVRA